MANTADLKNMKIKRGILKEVYTENLEAIQGNIWRRQKRQGSVRSAFARRFLPLFIIMVTLLSLSLAVMYFLYPQTLVAFNLGWFQKTSTARTSFISLDDVNISIPEVAGQLYPKEEPINEKDSFNNAYSGRKLLVASSPENYYGLMNTKDFNIATLFDLSVKTIVIDPGHGGRDPGAIGKNGLKEKEVTLDIARRLRNRLEKHLNYRIFMTRNDDVKLSLKDRVEFANNKGADLFISIHVNSISVVPLMVIETYFFGAKADQGTIEVAEKENQGSEYLMAEFKDMIAKISDNFKQQESETLAMCIQRNLFLNIHDQNDTAVSRGIKSAPFIVLLGTNMPSILTEVSCISSEEEEKKLAAPIYREEIASYLESGIIKYLEKTNKEMIKGVIKNANRE